MRDKTLVMATILVSMLLLSIPMMSASAFIYSDGSEDTKFEVIGPRVDRVLVKKYNGVDAMAAALQAGEVDITDWALTKAWIDTFAVDPDIVVKSYGGEAGYYTINFNHNNNPLLGYYANLTTAPNPVYPNPTSVVGFRQASSHLVDRIYLSSVLGEGLYDPMFTAVPVYMAAYVHPDISYTGALSALAYPPSVADAATKFTAAGFPLVAGENGGKRFWDVSGDGHYQAGEEFNLKFYSRADILRAGGADLLAAGYDNALIQIPYTRFVVTGGEAWQICMVEKNYNMYTAGWIFIGPDPDYLYDLYAGINYYHPEDPPNFGFVNDATLNGYLTDIKYAVTTPDAIDATLLAQERFAEIAAEIPLAATSAPKAFFKYYTGGNDRVMIGDAEDQYRGDAWTHLVNQKGLGENSFYTTLNAYPEGSLIGTGSMTMRYAWKELSMPETLNPLYASWYWEWEALGRLYDSMSGRNPYTLGGFEIGFLARNWEVGTYVDPDDGITKSMVTVNLKTGIEWSDGHGFDADDVGYTFVDLPAELAAKAAPAVWWQPTVDQMKSYNKINAYKIEVKMKVLSVFSIGWVLGNIIVPQHVLSPFITNPATPLADISGNWWALGYTSLFVGTGPFLITDNTASTLLMTRNPLSWYWNGLNLPADLNYDGVVNLLDLTIVALALGSQVGDPTWDLRADTNRDGVVNVLDLVFVATKLGLTWP